MAVQQQPPGACVLLDHVEYGAALRYYDVSGRTWERQALVKARPNVFFLETLWGERRALYTAKPAWVDDPALRQQIGDDSARRCFACEQSADSCDDRHVDIGERTGFVHERLVARDGRIVWVQDEPRNMGAWYFLNARRREIFDVENGRIARRP